MGVGPAIVTAAEDDNAIVVDCTGMTIVPAVVDTVALAGGRGHRSGHVATPAPGNTTDFVVVPDELAADVPSAVATLMSRPEPGPRTGRGRQAGPVGRHRRPGRGHRPPGRASRPHRT